MNKLLVLKIRGLLKIGFDFKLFWVFFCIIVMIMCLILIIIRVELFFFFFIYLIMDDSI